MPDDDDSDTVHDTSAALGTYSYSALNGFTFCVCMFPLLHLTDLSFHLLLFVFFTCAITWKMILSDTAKSALTADDNCFQ